MTYHEIFILEKKKQQELAFLIITTDCFALEVPESRLLAWAPFLWVFVSSGIWDVFCDFLQKLPSAGLAASRFVLPTPQCLVFQRLHFTASSR